MFKVTRKDLEISYFSGSGAGGQHRNKHMNCVRLRHPESGAMVTAQDHREKGSNMRDALTRLANHPKFKWFCEQSLLELEGQQTVEKRVDEMLAPANIETYVRKDGRFVSELTGQTLDPIVEQQAE